MIYATETQLPQELKETPTYQAGQTLGYSMIAQQQRQQQLTMNVDISKANGVMGRNYGDIQ
jgi:hypothetical protein